MTDAEVHLWFEQHKEEFDALGLPELANVLQPPADPPRPEPKQSLRWWPPVLKLLGGIAWAAACWLFASLV